MSKSASDIGESAILACESRAVPNVTFVWKRPGGSPSGILDSSKKYQIRSFAVDPLTYRSELTVVNVSRKDYGSYECLVRNTEVSLSNKNILIFYCTINHSSIL